MNRVDSSPAATLAEIREWPAAVPVKRAAQAFGLAESTAYAAVKGGTFPAQVIKVGGRWRVLTSTIIRTLEGDQDQAAG